MKYFGSKKVYQHFRERVRVSEKGFCCAVTLGHQKRGNFWSFLILERASERTKWKIETTESHSRTQLRSTIEIILFYFDIVQGRIRVSVTRRGSACWALITDVVEEPVLWQFQFLNIFGLCALQGGALFVRALCESGALELEVTGFEWVHGNWWESGVSKSK